MTMMTRYIDSHVNSWNKPIVLHSLVKITRMTCFYPLHVLLVLQEDDEASIRSCRRTLISIYTEPRLWRTKRPLTFTHPCRRMLAMSPALQA